MVVVPSFSKTLCPLEGLINENFGSQAIMDLFIVSVKVDVVPVELAVVNRCDTLVTLPLSPYT